MLSSLALTGLVTAVAASTGGIASFAAIWLVIVPLEAALSASRRVVAAASTFALERRRAFGRAWRRIISCRRRLQSRPLPFAALGIVSAGLYATGLALGAEAQARTSFWLLYAEEDRYRLAGAQYHRRDYAARPRWRRACSSRRRPKRCSARASPTCTGTACSTASMSPTGPAYLTALGDAAALNETSSVEFRVRRDTRRCDGQPAAEFVWIEMRCRPLDQATTDAGTSAKSSRSCAMSPSANGCSKRSSMRTRRRSGPTRPRAASSPP